MVNTTARIKKAGKHFEIMVDMDNALKIKKGELDSINVEGDVIFSDIKKGERASSSDLNEAFGTDDVQEVAKTIITDGEVQTTQEHRSAEQEKKIKQVVTFLVTNAINPQSGNPYTPERIRSTLDEAGVNVKNVPVANQIQEIMDKITKILPIKLETKKVKIKVPAAQTGKVYGVIAQYKDSEKWLDNGDLEVIVKVPSGIIIDFYDKLNSITHGSAITEEIKEDAE